MADEREERRRATDRDIDKILWELDALKEKLIEREKANKERLDKLESAVEEFKVERLKWGGALMMLTALGGFLLWFSSIGSNIAKVVK